MTDPTKYVSVVVTAVSEGSIKTADGKEIKLDSTNLKLSDLTGRDLGTRVFQSAALNIIAHPGRFVNTADGAGQLFDRENNRKAFNGLVDSQIADLMHKLDGTERCIVRINTPDDLLVAFEKNGGGPMVITVDGSKAPIARDSSSAGHGGHVVTVTRIEKGPPVKVYVQNQWGLESDHSTPDRALPAAELLENMKRREGDSRAIIKGPRLKIFKIDGRNLVEDKDASKALAQDLEARSQ